MSALEGPTSWLRRECAPALERLALVVVVGVPLVFNPLAGEGDAFSVSKAAFLQWAVLALLGLAGTCGLARRWGPSHGLSDAGQAERRWRRTLREPTALASLGYGTALCFATCRSIEPGLSLWGAPDRGTGFLSSLCILALFLVVSALFDTPEKCQRLVDALLVASASVAVYGLGQVLGFDSVGWVTDSASPAVSTIGRSNAVAAFLAAVMPLTLGLMLPEITNRPRSDNTYLWLLSLLLAVQCLCLVACESRAGWLAALAGVLICLWLFARRRWKARLLLVSLVLVCVSGLSYGSLERGWSWLDGNTAPPSVSLSQARAASVRARLIAWNTTLGLVAQRPLLGYGPATFPSVILRDYPAGLTQVAPGSTFDDPHNLVLTQLFEGGCLGLLALAAVLAAWWARTLAALGASADDRQRARLASAAGSVAAVLIAAQFNRGEIVSWFSLWVVLALGLASAGTTAAAR